MSVVNATPKDVFMKTLALSAVVYCYVFVYARVALAARKQPEGQEDRMSDEKRIIVLYLDRSMRNTIRRKQGKT